ncbi:MAG: hypothetical protein OEZ48_13600, partial [Candidatus Bathyarchaeota archaeon]|nr:hypothetical protein [Candidatus Bathyarchaeota archaeon]
MISEENVISGVSFLMGDDSMNLEGFLRENRIWHRIIPKPETVHTADAADVTGIALNRITKNLVSVTDAGEYVMLVVP